MHGRIDVTDLGYSYSAYSAPIFEMMKKIYNSGVSNKFIEGLIFETSKAQEFYESIGIGYDKFIAEMEIMQAEINKNLVKLKNDATNILQVDHNLADF
jgi:hypothetical protein